MKISSDQIQGKPVIAGKTKDGRPVVYVNTKGGLHAFFTREDDGIVSIGAAPHRAIAKFLAAKKTEIEWNEDFEKSENMIAKSEIDLFEKLRKAMFVPSMPGVEGGMTDTFMVYDISKKTIEIMKKEQLDQEVANKSISEWALVRDTSLHKRAVFVKDMEDYDGQS